MNLSEGHVICQSTEEGCETLPHLLSREWQASISQLWSFKKGLSPRQKHRLYSTEKLLLSQNHARRSQRPACAGGLSTTRSPIWRPRQHLPPLTQTDVGLVCTHMVYLYNYFSLGMQCNGIAILMQSLPWN